MTQFHKYIEIKSNIVKSDQGLLASKWWTLLMIKMEAIQST